MPVIGIKEEDGFKAGEEVAYEGKIYLIVDFLPATDRWGQPSEGFEALLYCSGSQFLWRIHTRYLEKLED